MAAQILGHHFRHLGAITYCLVLGWLLPSRSALAGALEDYVGAADAFYSWKRAEQKNEPWGTLTRLELVSQYWRGQPWSHHLVVVRPDKIRNPAIGFLLITGDGDGAQSVEMLRILAERAGAVAAVITNIPNQPLYGRSEDALIAYTFDQYLKSGDETWPLLFPMVKSAVRGMDTVQAFIEQAAGHRIEKFIIAGASKRGWTAWLTGAVDGRISAIVPMVIDMLNMKAQLRWTEKVYGRQSEEISEYTELHLHQKLDDLPIQRLRNWVDPYAYRDRYTMPKLLLLGTNDPYWTVDSLRHYWNDLPGPKLIFQTPNAGHDLGGGKEAIQTLAAFFQMIADGQPLPKMEWRLEDRANGRAQVRVKVDKKTNAIRLWTAESTDRDFRNDAWSSHLLDIRPGSSQAATEVSAPKKGYRAYLVEVELASSTGHRYKLSTEARVTPDTFR